MPSNSIERNDHMDEYDFVYVCVHFYMLLCDLMLALCASTHTFVESVFAFVCMFVTVWIHTQTHFHSFHTSCLNAGANTMLQYE